ncbi:MAG TPA: hypothetical protein VE262_08785 [Blastocatellia bacterium]|nr:hypothetical protein [Blastocatellia bacterium]
MYLRKKKESSGIAWKIITGAAVAAIAAGLIISLPDIKRYVKISMM